MYVGGLVDVIKNLNSRVQLLYELERY